MNTRVAIMKIPLLVLLSVTIASILIIAQDEGVPEDMEQLKERLLEIQEEILEAQAQGDMNGVQELINEIQDLTREMQERAQQAQQAQPEVQTQLESVLQGTGDQMAALEDLEDHPCYPVFQEIEYLRRDWGIDPTWIRCITVYISVKWDIELYRQRHAPFPDDRVASLLSGC